MADYVYWFLLALVMIAVEMATGTFYLLVVSIAMVVGGLAALLSVTLPWQLVLSAVTVIGGTMFLRNWKGSQKNDVVVDSLDAGQTVQILKWQKNGTARVLYRGAEWDAELESADVPLDGTLYIKEMRGSSLVLTHRKP